MCIFFKKKTLRTQVFLVGPLIRQFWTSGDVSSGFQTQSGQPYSCYVLHVPRDLSVDLLAASMTADPLSSVYLPAVRLETWTYLANAARRHSTD